MTHPDCFTVILTAQDGRLLPFYPTYATALEEIQEEGAKQSCWMWYIWPTLRAVRQHRMPRMLLPSFAAAIEYLQHPMLGQDRLLTITRAAEEQLQQQQQEQKHRRRCGAAASKRQRSTVQLPTACTKRLMGSGIDAIKLHETCTVFAVAAAACGDTAALELFVRVVQLYCGGLHTLVLDVLLDEEENEKETNESKDSEKEEKDGETNREEVVEQRKTMKDWIAMVQEEARRVQMKHGEQQSPKSVEDENEQTTTRSCCSALLPTTT